MDEQTATPEGGASVQDRLERFLAVEDAPEQNAKETPKDVPDAPTEKPVEAPEDDGSQQEQQPQLTTADLAKVLGIDESALDVDEDGSIKVKTKIDGAEGNAKFADLLKSYQLEGHVNKKSMEVSERERALAARAQEVEQQVQARLQQVEHLANVAASEMMREYQSIDWNTLRQTDMAQYAALQLDFNNRKAQLSGVFQEVEKGKAQQSQQFAQNVQAKVAEEMQRLPDVIPEWKNPEVLQKESSELRTWALKSGIPAQMVEAVSNGPLASAETVAVWRKAMLFDRLQESKPAIENKVRTAPKIVRPGQAQQNTAAQNLQNLKQTVRKSGGKQGSVAAYLLAAGKV